MGEWDQPETHSDRHITPLGHGVPPDTDPDVLTRLVAFIHDQP